MQKNTVKKRKQSIKSNSKNGGVAMRNITEIAPKGGFESNKITKVAYDSLRYLEERKRESLKLLRRYTEYNDHKKIERIHDSICRCLDDLRRSLL